VELVGYNKRKTETRKNKDTGTDSQRVKKNRRIMRNEVVLEWGKTREWCKPDEQNIEMKSEGNNDSQ
jgi:hypothetical protein